MHRGLLAVGVFAGLMAYQTVSLVVAFIGLALSAVVLLRQIDQEGRLSKLEAEQLNRATAQETRLGDELRGD